MAVATAEVTSADCAGGRRGGDDCVAKAKRFMSSNPLAMIPSGMCMRSKQWPSSWSAAPRVVE